MMMSRTSLVLLGWALLTGCSKGKWLLGRWLLVDQGTPGPCHEFQAKQKLVVYTQGECSGQGDMLLSGKWQLKKENKLAVQRANEDVAHWVLISDRSADQFSVAGAMTGTMHRIKDKLTATISHLESNGTISVKPLSDELGCSVLQRSIAEIRKMPKEEDPRMLRATDQGLEFHSMPQKDGFLAKIVYGLNQDQREWFLFEVAASAFAHGPPSDRLSQVLGKPKHQATMGSGAKRQHLTMWQSYCRRQDGGKTPIDVTFFSSPEKKTAYYYLSTGVLKGLWSELIATASDPTMLASDEDGQAEAAPPSKRAEAEKPAGKVAEPVVPSKASPPKQSPAQPAPKAAGARKQATNGKTSGPVAVPGSDEDI